ncbi:MAG: glycosyltransferase, partial [Kaistella sp.]
TQKADVGLSIEENNGLSYYLSMPNKVSDYIQARIPVVVSDFPEMRKVIDHFGAGEKISDHTELADKVKIVLENGKQSYENALNHAASHLCWEQEEPKIIALFHTIKSQLPKT